MSDDTEAKAGWDALKEIAGKLQAKNASIQLTEEDRQFEAEHQKKLDEFHAKYPGNDGSETARVGADGSLQVHYSARGDGIILEHVDMLEKVLRFNHAAGIAARRRFLFLPVHSAFTLVGNSS